MMLLARLGCSQGHWDPDPTAWGQRAARLNPTPEAELARPRHPELAEQTPTVSPSPVDTLLWWACRWAARRRRLRRSGRSAGLECQCRAQRFWHPQAGVPGTRSC